METHENFTSQSACSEPRNLDNTQGECSSLLAPNNSLKHQQNYGGTESSEFHNDSSFTSDFTPMSSSSTLNLSPEEDLKRKLKYFFMNPLEKWNAKGKFPWKLVLQIVKIFFITLLLSIFGTDGYIYELQKQDTSTSFRHMFLPDWNAVRDTAAYPPNIGPYAVYTKAELYNTIDHFVKTYANITNVALGSYCFDGPNCTMTNITFCRQEFTMMVAFNFSVTFDGRPVEICHTIPPLYPEGDPRWNSFSIYEFLKERNDTIEFSRLISIDASVSLLTIFLKSLGNNKYPDCYEFHINIHFDNNEHDGQVLVDLETTADKLKCYQNGELNFYNEWGYIARQVLNCFIICICILSFLLCIRCLCKAHFLCKETDKHFRQTQNKGLSAQEKMEFVDMWYLMMVINDLCIITGCILKAAIEKRSVESDQYATCAILLGAGTLMVYTGVLRYLGFFRKYNILILTLKKAIPNVLRFMLCCILLYAGFCFCGWVVLGPYHMKFRSLSTTSECLFAMMNGDDLFATFAITNTRNDLIWWFSRIYLYIFISMFIYVVISLFISVIMDSYETVKDYYRDGGPHSRIQNFISEYSEDSCLSFYQQRRRQRKSVWQKLSTVLSRGQI